jgi:cell division protein FtsB
MFRGSEPPSLERAHEPESDPSDGDGREEDAPRTPSTADLSALPIAGLTRGRLLAIAALFAAGWIAIAFVRQVGAAGDLGARADGLRADNSALEQQVAALQDELALVQTPEYIALQARAHRLGSSGEVPFVLAPDAPPLAADAPGSAAVRLGAEPAAQHPLDAWLTLLFAPSD